jgi:hypothetical protein
MYDLALVRTEVNSVRRRASPPIDAPPSRAAPVPPTAPAMESQSLYTETPAPVADKTSVVEDFLDIFYAPSQVYERRRDGRFGLALLILVLVMVALFFATRAVMEPFYAALVDMQLDAMRKGNPNLPADAIEKSRGMMETMAPLSMLVFAPIIVFVTGIVLWLVGKMFDAKQTLKQAFMVSTYAQIPRFVLGGIISAVVAFILGPDRITDIFSLSLGLGRFAPEGSSMMVKQFLNRFELFTIWATVLLGIGLSVTGRIPRRQAFMAAGIVWLLATLWAVASAAAQG